MRDYPFSAIVGQEEAKTALLLNYINPAIGGVLLIGKKGSAKSTLVHGAAQLFSDIKLKMVPLNVTEDRLTKTADLSVLVKKGQIQAEGGLLEEAEKGMLYLDEVNLFRDSVIHHLLSEMSEKSDRFVLLGTMNPEEGRLSPQLLEKFGLCVQINSENQAEQRVLVMKRRMAFEQDTEKFYRKYEEKEKKLYEKLQAAINLLGEIDVSKEILRLAAKIAQEAFSPGNRTEILLMQTAMAICAYEGGRELLAGHVQDAAKYVLPHRMAKETDDIGEMAEADREKTADETKPLESDENTGELNSRKGEEGSLEKEEKKEPEKTEGADTEIGVKLGAIGQIHRNLSGIGKRNRTTKDVKAGHMIRSELRSEGELAICDTIKEAALHQRERPPLPGLALHIKNEDFRRQVKEGRTGATILFVVDASGSMGAKKRMRAVKGAVLSLLKDAYEKRDKVGVIAFRGETAGLLLSPTRSVDLAKKCLMKLPTGGKTPLAEGLKLAHHVFSVEKAKEKQVLQYMILLTDGRANFAKGTKDAREAAKSMAEMIHREQMQSLVLDTENRYMGFGFAKELADCMGSRYESLQKLDSRQIQEKTREFLKK